MRIEIELDVLAKLTPADEGNIAAQKDMINLRMQNFQAFVMDCIDDGMGEELSPIEFLRNAMEVFLDLETEHEELEKEFSDAKPDEESICE